MPGRDRKYDLILSGQGYIISGGDTEKPAWQVQPIPAELGSEQPPGDRPMRLATAHYGFGYGEYYVPGCYHHAKNMDASQPGVITLGPLVSTATFSTSAAGGNAIKGFFLANGEWYAIGGRFCKRLSVSGSTITVETPNDGSDGKDFGPGHVASAWVDWKGNKHIGFSSDHPIWQLSSNTWSQADPDTTATASINDATNASPIVITTSTAHGRSTGNIVTISSVGGNTAANGTWAITVLTATTFSLTGSTGNGAYTSGGTMSVATTVKASAFAKDWIDGTDWRLWRVIRGTVTIDNNSDDPLEADNWAPATPYSVGDSGAAVTGMTASGQTIWIAKADGLYAFDWTTRADNKLQAVQQLVNSNNGINLLAETGTVYFPHEMGLLEYDQASGRTRSVQPAAATGYSLPNGVTRGITGRVTAQVKLGAWHYAAVYNGTDSYILKGREPNEGMPQGWVGPMIWHPIVEISSVQITAMAIQGDVTPARLWFGYTSGTDYVVAFIRISKTGNHLAEASMTYAASGSIWFSPLDFGEPGSPKELLGFDIENEGFDSNTYAALFVSLDGGAFTQWGSNATTAGRTRLGLPSSGTWRGHQVRIRLDVTNASSTSTPKIKPVVARATIRPVIQDLVTCEILCMDDLRLRNGSRERQKGQELLTALNDLRDAAPKTCIDFWTGSSRSRTVIVERVAEQMIEQRGNDAAGYGVQLVFRVLP